MSRGTLDHTSSFLVSTTGLLPSMAELSNSLHLRYCIHVVCPQPQRSKLHWFGLFRVRSPLLTESNVSFSSSPYLDVSVQAVPHLRLFDSTQVDRVLLCRVSPFGNLRIDGYLHLPEAYRSLSRPSSAPDAKAFPLRSFQLDLLPCSQERSRSGSHEFELCRLQSS